MKVIIIIFSAIAVLFIFYCFLVAMVPLANINNLGVTYSKIQAEALGLDWKKTYKAIFEDLNIFFLRIPVYWPELEPEEGQFDFSSVDWMLEEAEKHGAQIVLAVGRRLPRWPECHSPHWVREFSISNSQFSNEKLLNYIETTIKRYDDNLTVWAWQVENEPFLKFGECPEFDKEFFDEEINLVRSLSDKPIIISDSGEFGDWLRAYKRADIFGSTLYRNIFIDRIGDWTNDKLGYFTYPLPPSFFRAKRGFVELFYDKRQSIIIELQAEPWGPELLQSMELEEHYKSMNPDEFKKILEYIKGTGFDTFYLWGVEWWYWLKEEGHPEMWELVKSQILNLKSKN